MSRLRADPLNLTPRESAEEVLNGDEIEQGYYTGRVAFELAGFLVGAGEVKAAGTAAKVEGFTDLSRAERYEDLAHYFENLPDSGNNSPLTELRDLTAAKGRAISEVLSETTMCFVAGTPIRTEQRLVAIEDIERGMWALSRDPETGEQGYKEVLDTFVTHPERLYHITIGSGLSGEDDEAGTLICTGQHPFYSVDAATFVEAAELLAGDRLSLSDASEVRVLAIEVEDAPEGETFTTYNFEVKDWHTYFAGEPGVWVHNLSERSCEELWDLYRRVKTQMHPDDPLEAFRFMERGMHDMTPDAKSAVLRKVLDDLVEAGTDKKANDAFLEILHQLELDNSVVVDLWEHAKSSVVKSLPDGINDLSKSEIAEFVERYPGAGFGRSNLANFDYGGYLALHKGPMPGSDEMYKAHAHHLVFKVGLNSAKQRALVAEAQSLLLKHGIDPTFDLRNLIWAPNGNGQHTTESMRIVLETLRDGDLEGDFMGAIDRLAERAANL